jgi:putative peptidoglycan lipid II flippase
VSDFDPLGTGGEHSEEVRFAIDGNPGTSWTTETYTTDNLGKEGVGIYVDAGKPVAATDLEVRSDSRGWDMQVYGTAEDPPPDDIEGWGNPIGETTVTEERTEIPLETAGKLRYYLVWITSPAAAEDDDGFLVQINEIRLLA